MFDQFLVCRRISIRPYVDLVLVVQPREGVAGELSGHEASGHGGPRLSRIATAGPHSSEYFDIRRTMVLMGAEAATGDATEPALSANSDEGPTAEELELATILHALSDPMRLRIVAVLAEHGEQPCKNISLPVVKSTCTHHFRVLRDSGVISQRVVGTTRLNSLRRDALESRFPGLLDAVLGAAGSLPGTVEA